MQNWQIWRARPATTRRPSRSASRAGIGARLLAPPGFGHDHLLVGTECFPGLGKESSATREPRRVVLFERQFRIFVAGVPLAQALHKVFGERKRGQLNRRVMRGSPCVATPLATELDRNGGPSATTGLKRLQLLVETMGLEPTTPCLQSRCSSQLSYVPGTSHGSDRRVSSTTHLR